MPARDLPRFKVQYGWVAGEDFWGGPMNLNLEMMDALLHPYIINMTFASPPQNVDDGDQYIIAAGASGAWAAHDGDMAYRVEGQWLFFTPTRGTRARLANINAWIWYNGVAWVDESTGVPPGTDPGIVPIYYDIGGTVPYPIEGSELLMFLPMVQAVSLPANAAGSSFQMAAGSPGYVELLLKRNQTTVGRIAIESGASTGTIIVPSPVSFGAGDLFILQAPDSIISGFKNFGWNFRLNIVG